MFKFEATRGGLKIATFEDRSGVECSIQESEFGDAECIWLGRTKNNFEFDQGNLRGPRMHVSRALAGHLALVLLRFHLTGKLE